MPSLFPLPFLPTFPYSLPLPQVSPRCLVTCIFPEEQERQADDLLSINCTILSPVRERHHPRCRIPKDVDRRSDHYLIEFRSIKAIATDSVDDKDKTQWL